MIFYKDKAKIKKNSNFEIEKNYYNKIKLDNKCGGEDRIKKEVDFSFPVLYIQSLEITTPS